MELAHRVAATFHYQDRNRRRLASVQAGVFAFCLVAAAAAAEPNEGYPTASLHCRLDCRSAPASPRLNWRSRTGGSYPDREADLRPASSHPPMPAVLPQGSLDKPQRKGPQRGPLLRSSCRPERQSIAFAQEPARYGMADVAKGLRASEAVLSPNGIDSPTFTVCVVPVSLSSAAE